MTALNIATQIPNTINTLEELAVWAASALAVINPTVNAVEGPGISERAAQYGIFYVRDSNKYRVLIRLSMEISPDHVAGGQKQWNYVQELSQTALPANFSS